MGSRVRMSKQQAYNLCNPIKMKEEATIKAYRLKPETVPTSDRNENTFTRWVKKVRQLANTSPDIFQGLGKFVPRRLLWNQLNICKYNYLSNSKLIGVFRKI
jgi:hypothetical protein